MVRFLLLVGLLLLTTLPNRAADSAVGTWRCTFPVETRKGTVVLNLLMMFSESDGKWVGDFLDSNPPLGADPTLDLTAKDDLVKIAMKFGPNNWNYEGKVQPGAKRIKGSLDLGGQLVLVDFVPSQLKSLTKDPFAVAKEALEASEAPADFFNALFPVLAQAAAKKMKPEEVRAYADKAAKLAEPYGPRWQRTVAFRTADVLADQEAFVAIAIEQARQGERLLTRTDDIATQIATLESVARILKKAKKEAEAKDLEGRVAKLEPRDFAEYAKVNPPFKIEEFKGRKAASDRAVLVEAFTGTECDACVPNDLAFAGLIRAYKPTDVIFLQYHVHNPGPDPMTSPDSKPRLDFYVKKDNGQPVPQFLINGKLDVAGPGAQPKMAKLKYQTFRESIESILEKPATVKLAVSVAAKGNELTIKGTVSDLEKPGEKVTLCFAVVEEKIRYQGGNDLRYHQSVVRSMPGGVKGFPMTKKAAEQSVTVKLDELKTTLNKGLDDFVADMKKQGADFNFPARPMSLRNLRVVAFIQNDETNEVLQAVQVEVEGGKE